MAAHPTVGLLATLTAISQRNAIEKLRQVSASLFSSVADHPRNHLELPGMEEGLPSAANVNLQPGKVSADVVGGPMIGLDEQPPQDPAIASA